MIFICSLTATIFTFTGQCLQPFPTSLNVRHFDLFNSCFLLSCCTCVYSFVYNNLFFWTWRSYPRAKSLLWSSDGMFNKHEYIKKNCSPSLFFPAFPYPILCVCHSGCGRGVRCLLSTACLCDYECAVCLSLVCALYLYSFFRNFDGR